MRILMQILTFACCLLLQVFAQPSSRDLRGATRLSAGFPGSESPYPGDAPIPVFGAKCAESVVIKGALLSEYSQVVTELYTPPASCADWSQVLLRMDGAVRGVQFDRYGAIWISGVEVGGTQQRHPGLGYVALII